MVKETISTCIPCLATGRDVPNVPLKMTRMSGGPWETLHVYFKGPLPGGKYLLVIVNRYSRYPVVELLPNISTKIATPKLRRVFSDHGITKIIVSDNGPRSYGHEFEKFLSGFGILRRFSTPYWPQGNYDVVERFIKTL